MWLFFIEWSSNYSRPLCNKPTHMQQPNKEQQLSGTTSDSINNSTLSIYIPTQQVILKRTQVSRACLGCQKACKKCDLERPCTRCVRTKNPCIDGERKERKKGIKRGPYKSRKTAASLSILSEICDLELKDDLLNLDGVETPVITPAVPMVDDSVLPTPPREGEFTAPWK